jgi:hypothetical protein
MPASRCALGLRASGQDRTLLDMNELVFDVTQEADGGYCAECLTESIVTEGNNWDELRTNVREAVRGYYFDQPEKLALSIRLHQVRDEVLAA